MRKAHHSSHVGDGSNGHIVIFPFMAKGHTIPLIHLAAYFTTTDVRITFITTPANAPFLRRSLPPSVHLIILPFSHSSSSQLPPNCESTDALPSIDLHSTFVAAAASSLRSPFEAVLTDLVRSDDDVLCLISDFFLGWTLPICRRLNLPRIVFHGMSAFSMSVCKSLFAVDMLQHQPGHPFHVPGMPQSLLVDKSDVPEFFFKQPSPVDIENGMSDVESWGVVVNSFAELEGQYADLFESFYRPTGGRAWLVGPLSMLGVGDHADDEYCIIMRWLEEQEDGSVVYVSFGTQADVAREQMGEVAHGLARSGCKFLWAVPRGKKVEWSPPFPLVDLLKKNGKIVGWAPQREVLMHRATGGFVSHCGWNSVMEAVEAGVPMLAWPMMADQGLNAKLVVEELQMGVRISSSSSSSSSTNYSVVSRERVEEGVGMLMQNTKAREKAAELRRKAEAAVADGGSSQRRLEEMIQELKRIRWLTDHDDDDQIRSTTTTEEEELEDEGVVDPACMGVGMDAIKLHHELLLGGVGGGGDGIQIA